MKLFEYDDNDIESVLEYAMELQGKKFSELYANYVKKFGSKEVTKQDYENNKEKYKEIKSLTIREDVDTSYIMNTKSKGNLGNFVEKYFFGYKPNSNQAADFEKIGMELKVTAIDKKKNGSYRAGERLSITNISYQNPVNEDFYSSHVWEKIKKILLIQYIRDSNIEKENFEIKYVTQFTPPDADLELIIQDYHKINKKIKEGNAHLISESDTLYLGACTKGANKESSFVTQYYNGNEKAHRRNYCFKQSYMNIILQNYVMGKKDTSEPIIKHEIKEDFETYVLNRINKYSGKTDIELCELFKREYNNNKAQWNDLTFRMLGIKSNKATEFEKANIVVKTIRLEKNGKNKESMSLPTFEFKDLIAEEWENSTLYNYLESTKFLFVIFKKKDNHYEFDQALFWRMSNDDLNGIVQSEWNINKDVITSGIKFTITPKGIVNNNLPKKKRTKIVHIRPHNSQVGYKLKNGFTKGDFERYGSELPNGEFMTRQSFWLNNDYILKQIK